MLLNRWFVIDEKNVVVNLVIWDGDTWSPPPGHRIMREVPGVGIGWRIENGEWAPPQTPDANL